MVAGENLCTHRGLLCQDRETQAPRAMRVVTTAVKTTEESTKGIRNMNFIKVLCSQLVSEDYYTCGQPETSYQLDNSSLTGSKPHIICVLTSSQSRPNWSLTKCRRG